MSITRFFVDIFLPNIRFFLVITILIPLITFGNDEADKKRKRTSNSSRRELLFYRIVFVIVPVALIIYYIRQFGVNKVIEASLPFVYFLLFLVFGATIVKKALDLFISHIQKSFIFQKLRRTLTRNKYLNPYTSPLIINLIGALGLVAFYQYIGGVFTIGITLFGFKNIIHNMSGFFDEKNKQLHSKEFTKIQKSESEASLSNVEKIIIPFGTQIIDSQKCFNSKQLKKVEMPETVLMIGERAFEYCEELSQINLPETIQEIGEYAFSRCYKLREVTIPLAVTEIQNGTFEYCTGLTSVTISENVERIGDRAFSHCSSLETIIIPPSVSEIGKDAFAFSGLQKIIIPNSVRLIGANAFHGCLDMTSLTFNGSKEEWERIKPMEFNQDFRWEMHIQEETGNIVFKKE